MSKSMPGKASEPHVSIIGHITDTELRSILTEEEAANGFANRILWCCVKRSKELADDVGQPEYGGLITRIAAARERASTTQRPFVRDGEAAALWRECFHDLTAARGGMLGSIIARRAPLVLRLALGYALLDQADAICRPHLEAALAAWDYCEKSAQYLFATTTGNPTADKMFAYIRRAGAEGIRRSVLAEAAFSSHLPALQFNNAIDLLERMGMIETETDYTAGRPAYRYRALST